MPTLHSIGVHPQLRERLQALEPPIETPQAFLSRDPTSLAKALDAPLSHIEQVRAAIADALITKTPHGKRALRINATVGNGDQQQPIIVGAVTALDLCRYHEHLHGNLPAGISTHSHKLDQLLAYPPEFKCLISGGIPFGYVTQVTGPPASGKTQVALRLAAEHASHGAKVLFLASGFGHGALLPFVRRLQRYLVKETYQTTLRNITFVTVNNGHEALAALESFACSAENDSNHRPLVIFDSASGCLSANLYAAGDGDTGKTLAQQVAYSLRRLARHNGAAVLVTNGTVSGDKGAMGQAWYAADVSLWFQIVQEDDGNGSKRIRATLEHHAAKPPSGQDCSVEFAITTAGIADVDEPQPMVEQQ